MGICNKKNTGTHLVIIFECANNTEKQYYTWCKILSTSGCLSFWQELIILSEAMHEHSKLHAKINFMHFRCFIVNL